MADIAPPPMDEMSEPEPAADHPPVQGMPLHFDRPLGSATVVSNGTLTPPDQDDDTAEEHLRPDELIPLTREAASQQHSADSLNGSLSLADLRPIPEVPRREQPAA